MMRTLITWAARAAAVAVAGLAAAAIPASAGATPPDLGDNPPNATVTSYDCEVELVLDNAGPYTDGLGHDGPWFVAFDWRLPGDVQLPVEAELDGLTISDPPLAGQPFDGLHHPVPVPAGDTVTVDVTAAPGTTAIEVRLVRGAEQRVFWDWRAYPVNCPAPSASPTAAASPTPEPSPTVTTEPSPAGPPAPGPPAPGGGGELAQTGADVRLIAGAGGALAGAGVFAVVVGRRRRRALHGR